MQVACLFVANFLVALARRDNPQLRSRAVVVGGAPEEHAQVTACSEEATAAGVNVGTTLRRALALCPDAVFLPLQETFAAAEAAKLTALLERYSPAVEVIAPGHAHFDVRGLARLAGMEDAAYLRDLHEAAIAETNLPVHIGAAETVFAAHAAAAIDDSQDSRLSGITQRSPADSIWRRSNSPSPAGRERGQGGEGGSAGDAVHRPTHSVPLARDSALRTQHPALSTAPDQYGDREGADSSCSAARRELRDDSPSPARRERGQGGEGRTRDRADSAPSTQQPALSTPHVRLIEGRETRDFLASLPVEVLPLPPEVHLRMRLFGLERVGQIADLPLSAIQAQFGREGARAWGLARGKDDTVITPAREELRITDEMDLPAPAALCEPIVVATRAILQRALNRPEIRGQTLRRLDWRLGLESGEQLARRIVFREPTNDLARMLFILKNKIERLQLAAPAIVVSLTLSGLCSEYGHQKKLWQTGPRRRRELLEAVDQLNAREGEAQVYRIVEVQPWSRIPERQLALVAFGA